MDGMQRGHGLAGPLPEDIVVGRGGPEGFQDQVAMSGVENAWGGHRPGSADSVQCLSFRGEQAGPHLFAGLDHGLGAVATGQQPNLVIITTSQPPRLGDLTGAGKPGRDLAHPAHLPSMADSGCAHNAPRSPKSYQDAPGTGDSSGSGWRSRAD